MKFDVAHYIVFVDFNLPRTLARWMRAMPDLKSMSDHARLMISDGLGPAKMANSK